jgi:O-antigen biosynthesis protein
MLSVFTPTKNPTWLMPAYQSLLAQTHQDWEWLLVLNGELRKEHLPTEIQKEPRARFYRTDRIGIGALKNYCCRKARGDVFVEFDHDDWLMPTCLEKIAAAAAKTPNGFFYSNFLYVKEDGTDLVFDPGFGWQPQPVRWEGRDRIGMRAIPVTARSLCEIYYAPDHVRAWSREAYMRAGGHDTNLEVGDDHDLLIRSYLAGIEFVHLDEVLYVYRWHNNTVMERQGDIAAQQTKNKEQYLHALIQEEGRRRQLPCVDLSPDNVKDKLLVPREAVNILDVPSDSVFMYRMNDCLQLWAPQDIVPLMNNVWRTLAPGGWFCTMTPAIDDPDGKVGRGAFQDPRHKSYWSLNNWDYFSRNDYIRNLPDLQARFQLVRTWHGYPTDTHKAMHIPYITVDAVALKGQQTAGWKYC